MLVEEVEKPGVSGWRAYVQGHLRCGAPMPPGIRLLCERTVKILARTSPLSGSAFEFKLWLVDIARAMLSVPGRVRCCSPDPPASSLQTCPVIGPDPDHCPGTFLCGDWGSCALLGRRQPFPPCCPQPAHLTLQSCRSPPGSVVRNDRPWCGQS